MKIASHTVVLLKRCKVYSKEFVTRQKSRLKQECPNTYGKGSRLFLWTCTRAARVNITISGRLRLKCDGTHAETRFRLSAKRTSPFKSAGASVQPTIGRRAVHTYVLTYIYIRIHTYFFPTLWLTLQSPKEFTAIELRLNRSPSATECQSVRPSWRPAPHLNKQSSQQSWSPRGALCNGRKDLVLCLSSSSLSTTPRQPSFNVVPLTRICDQKLDELCPVSD
jgi:hypothetical protein